MKRVKITHISAHSDAVHYSNDELDHYSIVYLFHDTSTGQILQREREREGEGEGEGEGER